MSEQTPLTPDETAVFDEWFGPASDGMSAAVRRAIRDGLYALRAQPDLAALRAALHRLDGHPVDDPGGDGDGSPWREEPCDWHSGLARQVHEALSDATEPVADGSLDERGPTASGHRRAARGMGRRRHPTGRRAPMSPIHDHDWVVTVEYDEGRTENVARCIDCGAFRPATEPVAGGSELEMWRAAGHHFAKRGREMTERERR